MTVGRVKHVTSQIYIWDHSGWGACEYYILFLWCIDNFKPTKNFKEQLQCRLWNVNLNRDNCRSLFCSCCPNWIIVDPWNIHLRHLKSPQLVSLHVRKRFFCIPLPESKTAYPLLKAVPTTQWRRHWLLVTMMYFCKKQSWGKVLQTHASDGKR